MKEIMKNNIHDLENGQYCLVRTDFRDFPEFLVCREMDKNYLIRTPEADQYSFIVRLTPGSSGFAADVDDRFYEFKYDSGLTEIKALISPEVDCIHALSPISLQYRSRRIK